MPQLIISALYYFVKVISKRRFQRQIVTISVFLDLAVSAPYDGTDQGGAIYIFHGSEDGLRTKVSQVILTKFSVT